MMQRKRYSDLRLTRIELEKEKVLLRQTLSNRRLNRGMLHLAFKVDLNEKVRVLSFGGRRFPHSFTGNKINNQKYNILTFVPVVLFNQFKFFFNLFFLLIALSQFIKVLRVGTLLR